MSTPARLPRRGPRLSQPSVAVEKAVDWKRALGVSTDGGDGSPITKAVTGGMGSVIK
ncbi:MAG TPA: hypothetical protein VIF64_09555 [Pyrinomonadaceae bacterium]